MKFIVVPKVNLRVMGKSRKEKARYIKNDIQSTILQIYQDQYTPQFEKALQKTKNFC